MSEMQKVRRHTFRLPVPLMQELKRETEAGGHVREVFGYRSMTDAVEGEIRKLLKQAKDAKGSGRRLDSFR